MPTTSAILYHPSTLRTVYVFHTLIGLADGSPVLDDFTPLAPVRNLLVRLHPCYASRLGHAVRQLHLGLLTTINGFA